MTNKNVVHIHNGILFNRKEILKFTDKQTQLENILRNVGHGQNKMYGQAIGKPVTLY